MISFEVPLFSSNICWRQLKASPTKSPYLYKPKIVDWVPPPKSPYLHKPKVGEVFSTLPEGPKYPIFAVLGFVQGDSSMIDSSNPQKLSEVLGPLWVWFVLVSVPSPRPESDRPGGPPETAARQVQLPAPRPSGLRSRSFGCGWIFGVWSLGNGWFPSKSWTHPRTTGAADWKAHRVLGSISEVSPARLRKPSSGGQWIA